MLLGKRKTLEEANPIIKQLEEERLARIQKNENEILREKEEKTVIFGVKSLTTLLDSIEAGDAYKRLGTRTINKGLAKWGNQVVASPTTKMKLPQSPNETWKEVRQSREEHGRQIRSIVQNLGIYVSKKRDKDKPGSQQRHRINTEPVDRFLDRTSVPIVDVDGNEQEKEDKIDEQEDDLQISSMPLPVIRAVDQKQRKYIRQMPRQSRVESLKRKKRGKGDDERGELHAVPCYFI